MAAGRIYTYKHHVFTSFREWLLSHCEQVEAGHDTHCWLWRGPKNRQGYARAPVPKRLGGIRVRELLHRAAYERLAGPIPDGLVIDHLCRNRRCVNPTHLEPVTIAENLRRMPPDLVELKLSSLRRTAGAGGKARAANLSPERRQEIGRKAAQARWGS